MTFLAAIIVFPSASRLRGQDMLCRTRHKPHSEETIHPDRRHSLKQPRTGMWRYCRCYLPTGYNTMSSRWTKGRITFPKIIHRNSYILFCLALNCKSYVEEFLFNVEFLASCFLCQTRCETVLLFLRSHPKDAKLN